VNEVLTDLRHAARLLWRAPTFGVVAAGTLAIGIAANAVVFSFVNALLFPYLNDAVKLARSIERRAREEATETLDAIAAGDAEGP